MKTIEINTYKFAELSEESKQNAIEKLSNINVDFDWWNFVYEDAENVYLKISSFDIDRKSIDCKFIQYANETANEIIKNHGENCETYKTAKTFLSDWDKLVELYSDGINKNVVSEENEYQFDEDADNLENDFLQSISEDYLQMLSDEYDYLTSEDAIIESIEANEYDFLENGVIY